MALEVKNLFVKVEGKKVIKGVSLSLKAGEVVALMGPNGSGKSSLAYALAGHPKYLITTKSSEPSFANAADRRKGCRTTLRLDGESLLGKSPDERARMGLFLAFQYPMALSGVNVREILLTALRGREKKISAFDMRKRLEEEAEKIGVGKELLKRGLNDGFSGGEKKKMEMLQMRLLAPKYVVMDETDSGLDIDALKIVALEAKEEAKRGAGVLIITHYKRIFRYLKPDRVLVMKAGKIVAEGPFRLVDELEKTGYKNL